MDGLTLIRANQGHSIPVDVELTQAMPPEILWHGTGERYTASIEKIGLITKSRLYVHLSKDVDTAVDVGKRHGIPVVYQVAAGQMARAGYTFYLSANGVWLTKEVPVEFLQRSSQSSRLLQIVSGMTRFLIVGGNFTTDVKFRISTFPSQISSYNFPAYILQFICVR